ncbi:hypothetical protein [Polyangium mundeleinium]|uniref:Secreted protein n=1 Tax=Polyangium mundeleinium TaxID=2995306 RepID=A0ABT5F1I2_9BACT|nr:hypothetical protein [Polyangium mundeleinium]MDC0747489.1 hypothetical protein [Polyangium mundeleinium]
MHHLSSWLLVASLFVTGCAASAGPGKTADSEGENDKVKECNAVIEVINGGMQKLNKSQNETKDAPGTEQLRALADVMDSVGRDIEAVPVTQPELVRKVADYQDMVRTTAKAARDLARAIEAKDARGANAATSALSTAVKRESPLVDDINAYCQSGTGG